VDGDQVVVGVVVELDLVGDVHADCMSADGFASVSIPDYELVVILPAERGQVLFIVGEGKTLDEHFVEFQSVFDFHGVEVPDDDVGLETLVGLLTRSNVLATAGDHYARDVVVVSSEKLLSSCNNVSDHNGGAQWEEQVLVVWV
jgi:hypothetical protein